MPNGDETRTIKQTEGDRFALDHGGVALYGDERHPAMRHELEGQVVHGTAQGQPLVHMICWEENEPCRVELTGRVTVAGDAEAPVHLQMHHRFDNDHHQTHHIETQLAAPIHHAVQMRTPLELRFCNPWHAASDYRLEISLGSTRVISMRLTGATVCTPQPCEDDDCPPVQTGPVHP